VPVVSLIGDRGVSRGGLSILSNIGLPQFTVGTADQYVQTAASLASDLSALGSLRTSLRERMRKSALMDSASYSPQLEEAYRQMWRGWCYGKHPKSRL